MTSKYHTKVQQQLMKQILNLLILATCILVVAYGKFQPTQTTGVPNGVLDIQYSPDQKVVLFATQRFVQVHDGVSLVFYANLSFPDGLNFSSLRYSQDDTKFAIGFVANDSSSNFIIYTADSLQQSRHHKVGQILGSINSLCFSADNKNLVMGTSNGDIVVMNEAQEYSTIKFDVPITSVACSPFRSLQFSVAGGLSGTQKKLSTFNYNPVSKQISEIKIYSSISQTDVIFDLIYTPSGTQILYCGTTNQIQIKSVDQNQSRFIVWPEQYVNLHKIRMSLKGDIISATTGKGKLVIQKTTPTNAVQVQEFTVLTPTFGLGPHGANLVYINQNNTGSVLGQCLNGQFLNDTSDQCQSCNPACSLCLDSPASCHLCNDGHYLTQNYQCLNCLSRCRKCTNNTICQTCNDPFISVNETFCGCKLGTFIDSDKCTACPEGCLDCSDLQNCKSCDDDHELVDGLCQAQGFPTWAIILLIIVAISVVIIILAIITLKLKRTQKQSPLLDDPDQVDHGRESV